MVNQNTVHELVSRVVYNKGYDGLDGLDPLRHLLWKDADGTIAACLEQEMRQAPDRVRGGIAFLLGAWYLEIGRLGAIRAIYRNGDPEVAAAVLGSLTGEPTANPEMGAGIVALAVEGASHPAYRVRAAACSVLMNQCAWGVDVSCALVPILNLLDDTEAGVRQSAAYAIGNFARIKRYDLTPHIAVLVRLLHDENIHVCTAAGWAFWKLSGRRDIAAAVPALVKALEAPHEYEGPHKNAAGALLNFARKSPQNRAQVRQLATAAHLDTARKENLRFLQQLSDDR
jgi:HEAT repeat protein